MLRVWKWYHNCLVKHPVKTQMISSGVLWGLGDIAAQSTFSSMTRKSLQSSEEDEKFKIDWRSVRRTSLFGFAVVGPAGHFWVLLAQNSGCRIQYEGRDTDMVADALAKEARDKITGSVSVVWLDRPVISCNPLYLHDLVS